MARDNTNKIKAGINCGSNSRVQSVEVFSLCAMGSCFLIIIRRNNFNVRQQYCMYLSQLLYSFRHKYFHFPPQYIKLPFHR